MTTIEIFLVIQGCGFSGVASYLAFFILPEKNKQIRYLSSKVFLLQEMNKAVSPGLDKYPHVNEWADWEYRLQMNKTVINGMERDLYFKLDYISRYRVYCALINSK